MIDKNSILDDQYFVQVLEPVLGQTIHDLIVSDVQNRLYSKIWFINVVTNYGSKK